MQLKESSVQLSLYIQSFGWRGIGKRKKKLILETLFDMIK